MQFNNNHLFLNLNYNNENFDKYFEFYFNNGRKNFFVNSF